MMCFLCEDWGLIYRVMDTFMCTKSIQLFVESHLELWTLGSKWKKDLIGFPFKQQCKEIYLFALCIVSGFVWGRVWGQHVQGHHRGLHAAPGEGCYNAIYCTSKKS